MHFQNGYLAGPIPVFKRLDMCGIFFPSLGAVLGAVQGAVAGAVVKLSQSGVHGEQGVRVDHQMQGGGCMLVGCFLDVV